MKTFITDTDREKHIPIRVFEDGAANNQMQAQREAMRHLQSQGFPNSNLQDAQFGWLTEKVASLQQKPYNRNRSRDKGGLVMDSISVQLGPSERRNHGSNATKPAG